VRLARESRHRRSNIHPPFSSLVVFAEHGDSSENRGKRQGARDKGRRAGAESRSGVSPLSERSAVRLAREARRRRSNIHPPFSSFVVFEERGDSPTFNHTPKNWVLRFLRDEFVALC